MCSLTVPIYSAKDCQDALLSTVACAIKKGWCGCATAAVEAESRIAPIEVEGQSHCGCYMLLAACTAPIHSGRSLFSDWNSAYPGS